MSSSATDAVRNVSGSEKDEEKATAPIEEARPLDSQVAEPETAAGDAEATGATKAATVPASSPEEHVVPEEAKDGKQQPPEQNNTSNLDKPKPLAASTHSKASSLSKSLSNGKLFGKKSKNDASKRDTAVTRKEPSNLSSASDTLDLKKKKEKKRGRIWRFIHSCFTPNESHVVLDDFSAVTIDSRKKRASASDVETKEKKKGDMAVDTAVAGATIPTSAPSPPSPSKSHSASATGAVEVVVPPTPKHELLPLADTEGVTSGAVQPPGSTGLEVDDSDASVTDDERHRPLDEEDDEERLIMNGGNGIPIGPDGKEAPLLPPLVPSHKGRKCLVLDLDETLVHSSFKLIPQADYVVPVEIEWQWHNVYVIKRPGVDAFLKRMGEIYEIVVFTASLSKYADPVLDKLDVHKVVSHRLFRESCYLHKGNYVKDLSQLGRPIGDTIILDNSPASYIFHPNNAVPVSSWFNDPHDTELTDMSPFLADLAEVSDIRGVLDGGV